DRRDASLDGTQFGASRNVPDSNRAVHSAGDQFLAVAGKGHAAGDARKARRRLVWELLDFLPGLDLPEVHGHVIACRGDGLAVWTEGDPEGPALRPANEPYFLACCDVPKLNAPVAAAGDEPFAVASKNDTHGLAFGRAEAAHLLAGGGVPQGDGGRSLA